MPTTIIITIIYTTHPHPSPTASYTTTTGIRISTPSTPCTSIL
jgi:hypothetical protein